jgi:hypothetical protein
VGEDEHMGGIVIPKRSEMLNNSIERVTDILGSLRVSDAWNETVVGYNGKDAFRSKVSPKVVVYEVGRGRGAGTSNEPASVEEY